MKKIAINNYFTFCLIVFSFLTGCEKQTDDLSAPPQSPASGEVTEIGTPDDSAKTEKQIGTAGGSLTSTDGKLTVIVPQGALNTTQSVSIQRISNTNPIGQGLAYRILPHGIQFEKPVQLIFNYEKSGTATTQGIAYQDVNNIWQAVGGATVDQQQKTVTVSTTHFSDWSLFDCLWVTPATGEVQPGGSVQLDLQTFDELLAPLLPGQEKPIGKPMKPASQYIKKWELIGPGTLSADGAKAIYHAPDGTPEPDEATVNIELDLGVRGTFILVARIKILYSAVRLTWDQHPEIIYKSATAVMSNGQVTISAGDGEGLRLMLNWQGGIGKHIFAEPQSQFGWFPDDERHYVHFYTDPVDHQDKPGTGAIEVTSMGETDGFIKGTFELDPIGKVEETGVIPSGTIKGSFQVKIQ